MQKDISGPRQSNGTKVPKPNGNGMAYHKRSTDVDDQVVSATLRKWAVWSISLIAAGIVLGTYAWRLSAVECKTNMLVDVIVYHKAPEQPRC